MTSRDRQLEAPHRRLEPGSRIGRRGSRLVERGVVVGYRVTAWVVAHVPPAIPRFLIARGAEISYLLWPEKRRWRNLNYAHVLGLPPNHRRVRWTAFRAYGEYARYVVEMMRLPHLPPEAAARLLPGIDIDVVEPVWKSAPGGGLIFTLGHIGNPEAVAAAVASRGWPANVLADDSSFPEMFEVFKRTRERWGVHVIPWRSLREIYAVLRRREMLGLLVDWGYRADGIPVKIFGSWTTLPAGPATLAAKTGSRILPLAVRRQADGRTFHARAFDPIDVPSSAPADLLAATQRVADALAASIAAAPDQWYSFKPLWPSTPAEAAILERRAAEMAKITAPAPVQPTEEATAATLVGTEEAMAGAETSTAAVAAPEPPALESPEPDRESPAPPDGAATS
jgi:phosphatidylinositol dimannoside acyltransferase